MSESVQFRAYVPSDIEGVANLLRSNIPKYFTADEEDGLRSFLDEYGANDYYVLERDGHIAAAGGIALNEDDTVSLCWGMVRNDLLGTGLGKALTQFRIGLSRDRYPGKAMVISTSQHTSGFYERYGFRVTEHTIDGFSPGIDICKMRADAKDIA